MKRRFSKLPLTASQDSIRISCMKLRFSIRDLLWLTLAAALIIGWWLDRSRLVNARFDFRERDDMLFMHDRETGHKWYKTPGFEPWYPSPKDEGGIRR
jgi:hypothetical protein